MRHRELKNKPLLEAIFEVKWRLINQSGFLVDPHYELLIGRLQERVNKSFPYHETLPYASLPSLFSAFKVQHRLRKDKDEWPLIQIGPGIMSINETQNYSWATFKPLTISIIKNLFDAHPKRDELIIERVLLRYVDGYDFKYSKNNVFDFLKNMMKIEVKLPDKIFANGINDNPSSFSLNTSFISKKPKGFVQLKFGLGDKFGQEAIIWESIVQSQNEEVPKQPTDFDEWLETAHRLTRHCFDTLIEGELEKVFSDAK